MRGRKTLAEFEQDLRSMVHFPDNVIMHYEINKASAVDTAWICQYANNKKPTKNNNPFTDLGPHFFGLTCGGCRLFLGLSLPFAFPKGLFVPPPPTTTTRLSHIRTCATERRRMGFMFFLPIIQKSEVSVWKAEDNGGGEKRRKRPTKNRGIILDHEVPLK